MKDELPFVFGFSGKTQYPDLENNILELARKIERLGHDSFFLPGGGFRDLPSLDTVVLLGAVSSITNRIKIGSSILVVTLFHPLDIARKIVTLDRISNGRLIFGAGPGWLPQEYENVGLSDRFKRRFRAFNESMDLIMKVLTTDNLTFEGEFFKLKNYTLRPKAIQKPHPPFLVGGGYNAPEGMGPRGSPDAPRKQVGIVERALERIARYADGWVPTVDHFNHYMATGDVTPYTEGLERIKRYAQIMNRELDWNKFYISQWLPNEICLGRTRDEAVERAKRDYLVRLGGEAHVHQVTQNVSFEALQVSGLFDTPENVAKRLQKTLDLAEKVPQLKRFIIMFAGENAVEQLEMFDAEVLPRLVKR